LAARGPATAGLPAAGRFAGRFVDVARAGVPGFLGVDFIC